MNKVNMDKVKKVIKAEEIKTGVISGMSKVKSTRTKIKNKLQS